MTIPTFIAPLPYMETSFSHAARITTRRARRPALFAARSAPSMSGRGFGNKPPAKPQRKGQPKAEDMELPGTDASYIPRGPTLRQDYERRGVIEPERDPDAGVLPELVANRMLRRILTFGAVPLGMLFVFFAVYFVLKYKYDITVIPVVVAYSTLGTVALSTLGITYGIFSSSWDEDVEGSRLGLDEAKINFLRAKDGLVGARQKEIKEGDLEKLDKLNEYRRKQDE